MEFNVSHIIKLNLLKHRLFYFMLMVLLSSCGGGSSPDTNANSGTGLDTNTNIGNTNQPLPQGARVLGMDIKPVPSVTYAMAYGQAMDMGVREVSVSLNWATLEPVTGNYDDSLPGIIEAFYPLQQADLTLVLRPLDTPGPSMPADLAGKPFDDPAVIAAFENFLTHLHGQLTILNASGKLKWIHVGNEIGAYLGNDSARWSQWSTFFNAARTRIKSLWGSSIVVGSIIQFGDLKDANKSTEYMKFLPSLDSAVLTYYPLKADFTVQPLTIIASDFEFMVNILTGKPVILQECGFPSSTVNNSSGVLQTDFITAVFDAWDIHRDRITLIDFTWQYDVSEAMADQWVIDYGMAGQPNENAFKHYLWSLGLSRYDSTEKLALQRLRDELLKRLWTQ